MKNKTCFVISPIGDDGSDTRINADDVFDLLIEPALETFGFNIIRADKIKKPSVITTEIIKMVQESTLCIIDLTEHNANVFYECGRRHENGKPFIQLIRKGEKLPFDLSGIRTIHYDISTPRLARKTVKEIQEYVTELELENYKDTSSGESMSSIAETLSRIERKINGLSQTKMFPQLSAQTPLEKVIETSFGNPQKILQNALIQGDFNTAITILPKLSDDIKIQLAEILGPSGDERVGNILIPLLDSNIESIERRIKLLRGLTEYYVARNEENEGASILENYIRELSDNKEISINDRAKILNSLQKLLYGAKKYEDALTVCNEVISLSPDEPSFRYNSSLIYEKLGQLKKSKQEIEDCLRLGTDDDEDHIAQAIDIYKKLEDMDKYEECLNKLESINPALAQFKRM